MIPCPTNIVGVRVNNKRTFVVVFIKTILTLDSQRGEQRQVGYPSSRFQQGREVIVKEKHSICVTPSFRRFFSVKCHYCTASRSFREAEQARNSVCI